MEIKRNRKSKKKSVFVLFVFFCRRRNENGNGQKKILKKNKIRNVQRARSPVVSCSQSCFTKKKTLGNPVRPNKNPVKPGKTR